MQTSSLFFNCSGRFLLLLASLFTSALAAQAQAPTPVYRWSFDGGSGTGVPTNTAGGGTLIAAGTGSFASNGLSAVATDFSFKTTSSAGIATNISDISGLGVVGRLTVTFWMNPTVAFSNQQAFSRLLMMGTNNAYDEASGGGNPPGFSIALNGGTNLECGVGPSRTVVTAGGLLGNYPSNQWVFVAYEYDGAGSNAFFSSALGTAIGNNSRNYALMLGTTNASVGPPTMLAMTLADFSTSPGSITMVPTETLLVGNRRGLDRGFFGAIDNINIYTNLLTTAQLEAVRVYTVPGVNLTNSDAVTASSFAAAGQWSNAVAPGLLNDYFTITNGLRTPNDAGDYSFGGHSLTLQPPASTNIGGPGYSFLFAGTNGQRTYTINNLVLGGGVIRSGSDAASTCVIAGGGVAVSSNTTINADQSSFVIAAPLSGLADLTNVCSPGLTVSYGGTNSNFRGRFILGTNASIQFNSVAAVPNSLAISTPGQFTTVGPATLIDSLGILLTNINGGITLNSTLTVSNVNAASNTIIGMRLTGSSGLTKTGPGQLTLNVTNSYTGNTTNSAGTLQMGIANAILAVGSVQVNGTLNLGGFNQAINGLSGSGTVDGVSGAPVFAVGSSNAGGTFSGLIKNTAGSLALIKSGTNTLTLSGATGNTYSGRTTISAGTLLVNNTSGSGSGSGPVTVQSGATLGGTGIISGLTTNQAGGTIAPGAAGIGTLTFGSAPVMSGAVVAEISTPNSADKISVMSGTLGFGGTLTVTNIGAALTNGNTFDLFDGTMSGTFSTLNLPGGAAHWNTNDLNVGGTITFTNALPVAQDLTVGVAQGGSVSFQVIGGKKAPTDGDGDSLSVTAVSAAGSGTSGFTASNVTYTASGSTGTNTFTYTVTDTVGGSDTKSVTVVVSDPQGFNQLSATSGGGNAYLTYLGIPGTNYALDVTHVLPATNWVVVMTNTAATNGYLYFTNLISLAPTNDYYRTHYVP